MPPKDARRRLCEPIRRAGIVADLIAGFIALASPAGPRRRRCDDCRTPKYQTATRRCACPPQRPAVETR